MGAVSCSSDSAGNDIINVKGKNATIDEYNESTAERIRGFETIKGTDWKGAAYTITLSEADATNGVVGLVFYEKDGITADGGQDFFLLGARSNQESSGPKLGIYLSYFTGVTDEELSSTEKTASFGKEYNIIGEKGSTYINLDGVKYDSENKEFVFTVIFRRNDIGSNGKVDSKKTEEFGKTFWIGLFNGELTQDESLSKTFNDDSNLLRSLTMAKTTNGTGLFTQLSDYADKKEETPSLSCASDTLSSLHTMCGEQNAEGLLGFYGCVYEAPKEGSSIHLSAAWDFIQRTQNAEVVEE